MTKTGEARISKADLALLSKISDHLFEYEDPLNGGHGYMVIGAWGRVGVDKGFFVANAMSRHPDHLALGIVRVYPDTLSGRPLVTVMGTRGEDLLVSMEHDDK
jgi:hypothetical protein